MAARIPPGPDEPTTRLRQVSLYTPLRLAILDELAATPGATASEVARRVGRHQATIFAHVHHLARGGLVHRLKTGHTVRLFLSGQTTAEERERAIAGETWELLQLVRSGEGDAAQLALRLGLSRSTVQKRLRKLARLGFVRPMQTRILVSRTLWRAAP